MPPSWLTFMPQVDHWNVPERGLPKRRTTVKELAVLATPVNEPFIESANLKKRIAADRNRTARPILQDDFGGAIGQLRSLKN